MEPLQKLSGMATDIFLALENGFMKNGEG